MAQQPEAGGMRTQQIDIARLPKLIEQQRDARTSAEIAPGFEEQPGVERGEHASDDAMVGAAKVSH
ncbi:MAG TPA: hypothetical protein VJ011_03255 [Steroidobacteraceae bacterium]|nr:hypothetical protein [Steroidobacteraceae bacterium]